MSVTIKQKRRPEGTFKTTVETRADRGVTRKPENEGDECCKSKIENIGRRELLVESAG